MNQMNQTDQNISKNIAVAGTGYVGLSIATLLATQSGNSSRHSS